MCKCPERPCGHQEICNSSRCSTLIPYDRDKGKVDDAGAEGNQEDPPQHSETCDYSKPARNVVKECFGIYHHCSNQHEKTEQKVQKHRNVPELKALSVVEVDRHAHDIFLPFKVRGLSSAHIIQQTKTKIKHEKTSSKISAQTNVLLKNPQSLGIYFDFLISLTSLDFFLAAVFFFIIPFLAALSIAF